MHPPTANIGAFQGVSPWATALFLVGALLTASLVRDVVVWWRLRHVPGPLSNSITSLVLMKKIFNKKSAWYFTELSDEYGTSVIQCP